MEKSQSPKFYKSSFVYVLMIVLVVLIYIFMMFRSSTVTWWDGLTKPSWCVERFPWILINLAFLGLYTFSTYYLIKQLDSEPSVQLILFIIYAVNMLSFLVYSYYFAISHKVAQFIPMLFTVFVLLFQGWYCWKTKTKTSVPLISLIFAIMPYLYIFTVSFSLWFKNL